MRNPLNKLVFISLGVFCAVILLSGCARDSKITASSITVRAEADKKTVEIGDKIKYTIVIDKDKDIEIEPSVFGKDLGNFTIKDFGSKRSRLFNKERISQWYILDTYITGKVTIPKTVIRYKKNKDKDWSQIETGEVPIEVKSVLEKAHVKPEMRDIKGPVRLPTAINRIIILLGAFILAGLGFGAWRLLKKNKQEQDELKRPAHEIAYEQLEALKLKDYINRGLIKEYYTEVSDIIRHYLENRFALKAPDMTTEEFLASARDSSELIGTHKDLLKEFLLCCDLVKFAKYAPSANEIDSIFNSSKNFIDQTKENDSA